MTQHSPDQLVQIVLDKWEGDTPPSPHRIATILREANCYVGDAAVLQVHDLLQARATKRTLPPTSLVDRLMRSIGTVTSPAWVDEHRVALQKAIEDELMPRSFEVRGRIVVDYAMGFTEAEAREWFPDVLWDDPDRSHAGDIETDHLDNAPKDFWDCVRIKRQVVLDGYLHETSPTNGWGLLRDEITAVVEL